MNLIQALDCTKATDTVYDTSLPVLSSDICAQASTCFVRPDGQTRTDAILQFLASERLK